MKPQKHSPTTNVGLDQSPATPSRRLSLLTVLLVSAATLALSANSASAQTLTNWLANPGFEFSAATIPVDWGIAPPDGWIAPANYSAIQNTNAFVYPSTTVHVTVHGGSNAFKIWGYNQGYTTIPGIMQTFVAAPGSTWAASAWASTQTPDTMKSTEASYVQVLFMDATTNYSTPLASYTNNPSAFLTPSSPASTWTRIQAADSSSGNTNLTAPAGTAFVRFQIIFQQPSGYPGGSAYWDDASLVRTSKPDPEITVQPVSAVTLTYGQTATFSVVADGTSTLSYLWQKDGANITFPSAHGMTTATLTVSNVTTDMQGNYTCTVTDQGGPLVSSPSQLTVNDPGVISLTPPLGQTVTNGATAKFIVSAAGSSPLNYAWFLNNLPLQENSHYVGTTTSNLTVVGVTTNDVGSYMVSIDYGSYETNVSLKVVSPAQLATNLLINPGFEDGVWSEPWENAWTFFNGGVLQNATDYYDQADTMPVSVWDGIWVAETYGGIDDSDGFYQTVPVTAGTTYHAGGMAYVPALTPLTNNTFIVFQFSFKDVNGNTLAAYSSTELGTNGITTNAAWLALQVTNGIDNNLVAPAGAVSATFQVFEYDPAYTAGNGYYDDLYITQAAAPAPAAVKLSAAILSGSMQISFTAASGVTYDVLYSSSPTAALSTWKTNTTVIGTGSVKSVTDTLGSTERFYRVRAHN